jgi:eukaryotic-like serine/threonine-protein kinase
MTGAAGSLRGQVLVGERRKQRWTVTEEVSMVPGHTPGHFSVAYKCKSDEGQEAFMKASDLGLFLAANDPLESLVRASNAHSFERSVLDHCRGNRMDRVVTALDYGSSSIVHEGVREAVFFLIFELAQGDLRKRVTQAEKADLLWVYTVLHNLAVALSQLHGGNIFHNDLKPANALVFDEALQKVADLGRATTPHFAALHDNFHCAGDTRFAAPEQLYSLELEQVDLERYERSQAGDLYSLGSMAHYLMTSRMVTPEVIQRLRPEFRPRTAHGGWEDRFGLVLPHWRAAYSQLMQEAADNVREDWAEDYRADALAIIDLITHLCDPDPMLRGHPRDRGGVGRYGLQRYVTMLDLGRQRLLIKKRNAKRRSCRSTERYSEVASAVSGISRGGGVGSSPAYRSYY